MRRIFATTAILFVLTHGAFFSGCATDSSVGKAAGQGAVLGAVGGAVAGAVGSLLWGGNPVEGAVKGGITGAASGAAIGATSAAMADSQAKPAEAKKPEPPPKEVSRIEPGAQAAEFKEKIGKQNFEAALLLGECKHKEAISAAGRAYIELPDPKQRVGALYIQAIAAEESGDKAFASALYPRIVQEDPSRGDVEKVRSATLEGVMKVQKIRQEHGLPPFCK